MPKQIASLSLRKRRAARNDGAKVEFYICGMNLLDSLSEIHKLDPSNMLGSIDMLHVQLEETRVALKQFSLPKKYAIVKNIVVSGMGGSALGPHTVQALYAKEMKVPMTIVNEYHLPAYANEDTLVVASSNSGSTEETLSCLQDAIERKCKIVGMTTGGKLAEVCREKKIPCFVFDQSRGNPSGQPRMSTGYMILASIGIFAKAGLISLDEKNIDDAIAILKEGKTIFSGDIPTASNDAKKFAEQIAGKIPIFIAAEFFAGTIHTLANQFNENGKNFSSWYLLPELNHHLMEGLGFPKTNSEMLCALFIESPLYGERIRERITLTKDVVEKNGISFLSFTPRATSPLAQTFEVLQFGSYVGFYLAMANGLNPSPIPWVDYFKKQLG